MSVRVDAVTKVTAAAMRPFSKLLWALVIIQLGV